MSQSRQLAAASAFKALHGASRGFPMPNVWAAGSAIVIAAEGFPAIATTSAGIAFSLGSVGGPLARAVLGFVRQGARELRERGTLAFAEAQMSGSELNGLFARRFVR